MLHLTASPGAGYSWALESAGQVGAQSQPILQQEGESTLQAPSVSSLDAGGAVPQLGAAMLQVMRFKAVRAGSQNLRLVYRRPWETGKAPLSGFSLAVSGVGAFSGALPGTPTPAPTATPAPAATEPAVRTLSLPSAYNICDGGKCTPIKDQASCGSCWAFATTGVLENLILEQDSVTRDLSEQYLVSCNSDGWNCSGGSFAHDYHLDKYISGEKAAGAVYEADFPYAASSSVACNPPHTHHEKIISWDYVASGSAVAPTADIKQAIYDHGPVAVAVCADNSFDNYSNGVLTSGDVHYCDSNGGINHAVVLVGWDESKGAWRLRNSWGSGWGESGYMWIKYGLLNVGYGANYAIYGTSVTAPAAPSGLTATAASTTRIDLSWTDNSSNETGFKVERSPDGSNWTVIASSLAINTTSYSDTGLFCGTRYYYRVKAFNSAGDSTASNTANTLTSACSGPPAAPTSLKTTPSNRRVVLSWTDNSSNESGFKIERSPNGTNNWQQVGAALANATTYSDSSVSCLSTYYYRVKATNAAGDSSASNTSQATTGECLGSTTAYLPLILDCHESAMLQNGGFEEGGNHWTQEGSNIVRQDSYIYSGSWSAWLGGYYSADDRLYQTIHVPTGMASARLEVYLYVSGYTPGSFHMELQDASGQTLYSFLEADQSYNSYGWLLGAAEWSGLGQYAGQDLRLYLRSTTGYTSKTNFYVDDISFQGSCLPMADTSGVSYHWSTAGLQKGLPEKGEIPHK